MDCNGYLREDPKQERKLSDPQAAKKRWKAVRVFLLWPAFPVFEVAHAMQYIRRRVALI